MSVSARRILACYRHELRVLFHSPVNVVFLCGFLVAIGLCVFQIGEFFSTDEVSLALWSLFLPWCGLILIPALAMRAWPDEYADRSVELSLTLPLSLAEVVFAKFLSGTTLILVALLFTMPFPATLAYLGSPDWGVVAAGYVAAFLLLAFFYSIALAVTAMLGDGISSYIAGVVVIFVLMLGGSDELTSLVADVIPFDWTLGLHAAFPGPHYRSLTSGFLEWRDVSWFVIAIVSLLVCCSMVIDRRRDGRTSPRGKLRLAGGLTAVFAAAALIQLASSQVPLEADLTEQDDFTLSDSTLATLQGLDGVVGIEFYWSKSEESVPQPIRNHADKALKFLRRVERAAGGRVEISRIDPAPDTDAELKALEDGIRVIPMTSGDYFFLGLRISHAGKQYTIPYLDAERAGLLEYDLLATLLRFVSGNTVSIGIISPLTPPNTLDAPRPGLSFIQELKRLHDVSVIPFFSESLPEDLDVLLVLQGTILKRRMLWAIDQFVMSGGTLIAAMDPMVRFDRPSNEIRFQPSEEIDDLSDLVLAWGLRYDGDSIVGDRNLASPVQTAASGAQMHYPYWLGFTGDTLLRNHPVVAALNDILIVEAGSLVATSSANVEPLLTTTEMAGTHPRDTYNNHTHLELAADFEPAAGSRLVAALIRGPLHSAYADVKAPAQEPHVPTSPASANVFVIADLDWLFDPFALHSTDIGETVLTRPLNDNIQLLVNMITHGSNAMLTDLRIRSGKVRRFTRIASMFREVEQGILSEEQLTAGHIEQLEQKLDEIRDTAGIGNLSELPNPLRDQAILLQQKLVEMRRNLRNIRMQMRQSVDSLELKLSLVNIFGSSLVVFFLAVLLAWWRRQFPTRWKAGVR